MVDQQGAEESAFSYCLRRLTAAARTEHDLRTKLRERGYGDEVIGAVLHRLRRAGYVNDAQFAQAWVRSRSATKALTGSVLRQELRRKGVDDQLIDAALSHGDRDAEDDRARALLRRKLPRELPGESAERDRLKRRLGAVLARKGYGGSRVWHLVDQVLDEAEAEVASGSLRA